MREKPVIRFERFVLDNGLRVIAAHDPAAPVVAVNLWYNVGSRNEREGRTGFAHLFEHMMFQGSQHVPENAHFALIEKVGGSLNGSTWLDRTNYFETLPSHHLELGLWLESDRLGWLLPAMTQEKLDNQRDVVKNERRWRVDNQPYGDWDEQIQEMMYPPDHPYHHSVIGSMADLDAATLEDVEAFFRTYYTPNNAVLTVAGDFDPAALPALVDRYFGEIPPGPPIPPLPGRTQLDPLLGEEIRRVVEQDVALPRVYTAYRIPPYGDSAFHAAAVAAHMLGEGKGSLLYRRLIRTGLAQDVVAYAFPIVVGAAILVTWTTAMPGVDVNVLETALLDAIGELRTASDADVTRAVRMLEASRLRDLQRLDERADTLSMFTMLFDEPDRINTEIERIRAVTTKDIRSFAERYFGENNRGVLQYLPRPS